MRKISQSQFTALYNKYYDPSDHWKVNDYNKDNRPKFWDSQGYFDLCSLLTTNKYDSDLSGLDLSSMTFKNVSFRGLDLSNCNFTGANFAYADFAGCGMPDAIFANCEGIDSAKNLSKNRWMQAKIDNKFANQHPDIEQEDINKYREEVKKRELKRKQEQQQTKLTAFFSSTKSTQPDKRAKHDNNEPTVSRSNRYG